MGVSGNGEVDEDAIGPHANKPGLSLEGECRKKTDAVDDSAHG
jgi:hypothetical protein